MRLTLVSLALAVSLTLTAQEKGDKKGPAGPPKNLKVFPADTTNDTLRTAMRNFTASLGVQCTFCHAQGDFASDDVPKKNIARAMMRLVGDLNARFPDGKQHVGCWTCHRGKTEPELNPPPAAEAPKAEAAKPGN